MAIPGPCGSGTVTSTQENILDYSKRPKGVTTLRIAASSGNTDDVLVNIPSLHGDVAVWGDSAWARLAPGESELFRVGNSEILTCNVKSAGASTPAIRWYPVSLT